MEELLTKKDYDDFFKVDALNIDSPLFNSLIKYLSENSFFRHPNLALGATLSLLSTLISREVYTPTGMKVGLYTLLLAETGMGKNDYLMFTNRMLVKMNLGHLIGESNLSSAVHIERIFLDKLITIHTIDEFNTFLKKISSGRSSINEQEINMILKKLWSLSYDEMHVTKGNALRESQGYICPMLNIIGASTPRAFFSSINIESFYDGLINRFLFFYSERQSSRREISDYTLPRSLSPEIIEKLKRMYYLTPYSKNKINIDPCPPVIIPWNDQEAINIFSTFFNTLLELTEEKRDLFIRLADIGLRIATIIAVSRDFDKARITVSDIKNGINIAKASGNYLYWGKKNFISENTLEQCSKRVINLVKSSEEKGITRTKLTRKTQMVRKKHRDEIISDLIESGQIIAIHAKTEDNKNVVIYKDSRFANK